MLHATNDAFRRGINQVRSLAYTVKKKARLHIPGPCGTVTCVPDPWRGTDNALLDKTCYVIRDGKCYVGQVAVWRCPCQVGSDFELWNAVPIPDEILKNHAIPNNCIIFSCKGYGVSRMAGGDSDGDLVMFSFNRHLASILKLTVLAEELDIDGINDWLSSKLNKFKRRREKREPPRTAMHGSLQERFNNYLTWLHSVKTPKVRGICCALAERLQYHALIHEDNAELVHLAYVVGLASHRAMDCPKKENAQDVIRLCGFLLTLACVSPKDVERSTKYAKATWTFCVLPELPPGKDAWHPYKDILQKSLQRCFKTDTVPLGRVWFHQDRIVLGYEAGLLIGEHMVNRPSYIRFTDRSIERTQLQELAYWMQHRFKALFKTDDLALIRERVHDDIFPAFEWLAPEIFSEEERNAPKRKPTTKLDSLLKIRSL